MWQIQTIPFNVRNLPLPEFISPDKAKAPFQMVIKFKNISSSVRQSKH